MMNTDALNAMILSLHDSVLLSVEALWVEGFVNLKLRSSDGIVTLSIKQFTVVECPRRLPWGRSNCVNEVKVAADPAAGGLRVTLEMQSGDSVLVCGAAVTTE
jgi:hypothetical protein